MSGITWYDVLGVLPDAAPEDIHAAWQARRAALQPGALAGAPPDVLSAADRARQVVEEAWGVLGDPVVRECYDEEIGFARPGEGLAPPGRGQEGRQGLARTVEPVAVRDDEIPFTERAVVLSFRTRSAPRAISADSRAPRRVARHPARGHRER